MLIYTYKEQVCIIKKYHEKFKILDILAVTTQAREGIDTFCIPSHQLHAIYQVEMRYKPVSKALVLVTIK